MKLSKNTKKTGLLLCLLIPLFTGAQMITGHWKGKINRQRVEVKIIQQGDRLTGTSYYYESPNHYRKYLIKGYFDPNTNSAVWWDDQLLEEKTGRITLLTPGRIPQLSRADFNCPGERRMTLEGKSSRKDNENVITGEVRLDKTENPTFHDEWDYIIDNYLVGGNDPELIEEVEKGFIPVALTTSPTEEPVENEPEVAERPITRVEKEVIDKPVLDPPTVITPVPEPLTIDDKFKTRTRKLVKEIPLAGDSLELRFYDNAEIDGDSISIFLNDQLIKQHIRLSGNAYSFKLAIADLRDVNELIMVAENLGAIPPNTSYMVAIVDGKKYDAYLSSTEGSSAMIIFRR